MDLVIFLRMGSRIRKNAFLNGWSLSGHQSESKIY